MMSGLFWSNTVWYILLFFTSVVTLAFAIKKSHHRRFTMAFTAATLGFVFYIESVLVIALNAYAYHPGLVSDPFQDTVLGNMFSQFSISSTSALTLVYGLSFPWYAAIAVCYFFIEELFVKLKIYEQFWYKSIFTLIGFPLVFTVIKMWFRMLVTSPGKAWHNITLYLSVNAVMSVFFTMPLKMANVQVFAIPLFDDASRSHTTTNLFYGLIMGSLFILIYQRKVHWGLKLLSLFALLLFRYTLFKTGIIMMTPGWFAPVTLVEFASRYSLITLFDDFLQRKPLARAAEP